MRARKTYDVGDTVTMRTTIIDPDTEKAVEPNTVVCTVNAPDGTVSTPAVIDEGHGVFSAQVHIDKNGLWRYAFDATGLWEGAEEREFKVRPQKVKRKV